MIDQDAMNISNTLIGQEKIMAYIQNVIESKRLANAYCFVGPTHVGKTTLVYHILSQILGIPVSKVIHHQDVLVVKREKNEKTGKTKKHIDVEQIRAIRSFSGIKPVDGKKRVVCILEANAMNDQSANALLKTLEEPASHTIFFLTAQSEHLLPDTIKSRCQVYTCHPTKTKSIVEYLDEYYEQVEYKEECARLAHGLPGLAIQWCNSSEAYEAYKQEVFRFHELAGKPLYQKLKDVEPLFGDGTDHIEQRHKIIQILSIWDLMVRDYLYAQAALQESHEIHQLKPHPAWTKVLLIQVHDTIQQAQKLLEKNIHPRLLIETILLTIP